MKQFKLVLFVIMFLYLISAVSASFSYNLGNDLKFCRCSDVTDSIQIKNNGDEVTLYDLSHNLDFVQVSPVTFELAPNQVQNVDIAFQSPCESFREDLKIKVKSNQGDDFTLVKNLWAGQCQNLKAKLYADSNKINQCEQLTYQVLIENTGSYDELYLLNSNNPYLNLISEVNIAAGESKTIDVDYEAPCEVGGIQSINIDVLASKNQLSASLSHSLNISDDYGFDVVQFGSTEFCQYDTNDITFTVENTGTIDNNYQLLLQGAPSFVKLDKNNLSIRQDDSKSFSLSYDNDIPGNYNFKVLIVSEYGNIVNEQNVSLNVKNCYSLSLQSKEPVNDLCYSDIQIPFEVSNLGDEKRFVVLDTNVDFASFNEPLIELEAGETKIVNVDFNPKDKDESYQLTAYASSDDYQVSDEFFVDVLSRGTCNYVKLSRSNYGIVRDLEDHMYLLVESDARSENTYDVELYSQFLELDEDEITLSPGQKSRLKLNSNHDYDEELGNYENTVVFTLDDLEYEHSFVLELKDKPISTKLYEYFSVRPCQLVGLILLISFVILLLFAIFIYKDLTALTKGFYILTVCLVVILIIAGALVYYFKGPPLLNPLIDYTKSSDSYFIGPQDSDLRINIDRIVEDPDNDELEVKLQRESDNIEFFVDGDVLVFRAIEGWYGIETNNFVATDSQGAFVVSPEVTFEFVKRDKYSWQEAYAKLCWHINWLLLFLNFLMIFILGFKKMRKNL